jgi:hypothetical protein
MLQQYRKIQELHPTFVLDLYQFMVKIKYVFRILYDTMFWSM